MFKLECDDGGIVFINENPIISKNFVFSQNVKLNLLEKFL